MQVAAAVGAGAVASSPLWLPQQVLRLRNWVFARVNGEEGVTVPGPLVPASEFKTLYGSPAADGRSRGAGLSDLFWYWLSPGPQVHQEHLEPGPRYDEVARASRQILTSLSKDEWTALVTRCTDRVLDDLDADGGPWRLRQVRLRDVMMPLWAQVYYEVVFGEECPADARRLIAANARDVLDALKCVRLRHMGRRAELTRWLSDRLEHRPPPFLPAGLTREEQVFYLQGTFFNTAIVQMSEAMTHLLMTVAEHPYLQDGRLCGPEGRGALDQVVDETLFHYPLFGVAHRITSADITRPGGQVVPAGSVLLFNYARYQHDGLDGPPEFDPQRWADPRTRPANFAPYGVPANRPCPARGLAGLTMRVAAQRVLARYDLVTSAKHTRSIPNRGPVLLLARDTRPVPDWAVDARLFGMLVRDWWSEVPRSLTQLVLGSYMVLDARRQQVCRRYFEALEPAREGVPTGGVR